MSEITSIHLKQAGIFTAGYISFATRGGGSHPHRLAEAEQDPSSVIFRDPPHTRQVNEAFSTFKNAVEEAIRRVREPSPSTTFSVADEIEKLIRLKEQNLITEAEFDQQRQKLLG